MRGSSGMIGRCLGMLFLGILVSGAPLRPPLLAAQPPVPAAPTSPAPVPTEAPADTTRPSPADPGITLEEAVRLALEHDPLAVGAEADLSRSTADLLEARGAWLPTVRIGSGYVKASDQRLDQATGRLVSENYSAEASADLTIFAGGRRLAEQEAASADVAAASADARSARYQTVLRTTETFYEAAAAADLERLAEQRLARARQQLDFAHTRLDLGTATTSDVLRAELEVGNARLALLDARSSHRSAALRLGRQIGVDRPVHPVAQALPSGSPELPRTEELVARAERSAPTVVSAAANLKGRRADKLAGYSAYLPALDLIGGYDWSAIDFPPDRRSWNIRLSASLPIFDGFQREAALRRAEASRRRAEAEAQDLLIGARVEVEAAVQEIESARQRIGISEHGVDLAREDLRVLEERYQIGAATILDLQASQVGLTEAEIGAVRARQGLGMAVARLEAVLGGPIEETRRD